MKIKDLPVIETFGRNRITPRYESRTQHEKNGWTYIALQYVSNVFR
jgi:hypothetical protein